MNTYDSKKNVDLDTFASKFMDNSAPPFEYKNNPIQIYPLKLALSFIKVPTPLFRTDYNFLLFFINGGGEQQIDNEVIQIKANDILFIREGHLNAIKLIDPLTEGYYLHIDNSLIFEIFADKALLNFFTFNPKYTATQLEMDWFAQCCSLILSQQNNFSYVQTIQTTLVKAMLEKLNQTWSKNSSQSRRQEIITMQFKELLYANFIKEKEVKYYADKLFISNNYLNRCVKNVTNKAPKQHLIEILINHSKVLLQNLNNDIAHIAFSLNFNDVAYFSKLFKQNTNQTPTQYRNAVMQGLL